MALKLNNVITPYGTFNDVYINIEKNFEFEGEDKIKFSLNSWVSEAARLAKEPEIIAKLKYSHVLDLNEFEFVIYEENNISDIICINLYNYLKTLPDFSDSVDC